MELSAGTQEPRVGAVRVSERFGDVEEAGAMGFEGMGRIPLREAEP